MKRILFALLTLFAFNGGAQSLMTGSPATITNATPISVVKEVKGVAKSVTIQFVVTKATGTIAGKATVQGSLNGTNYVNLDSMTLTDVATNSQVTEFANNPYRYYRVLVVGSGTMTGTLSGYIQANSSGGSSSVVALKSIYSLTLDTVTNAGTKTLTMPISLPYKTISIGVTVTKVSGTLGGTVTLQGSVNGVNYVTVPTSFIETPNTQTPYTTGGAATYTVPDYSAPTKIFTIIGSPYVYYRVSYTGTGTMVGTIKGNIFVTQ
jgi:hypothetical protein